nr:MAG TPA: hypothetical protein [Caudoviricetes sp.]
MVKKQPFYTVVFVKNCINDQYRLKNDKKHRYAEYTRNFTQYTRNFFLDTRIQKIHLSVFMQVEREIRRIRVFFDRIPL